MRRLRKLQTVSALVLVPFSAMATPADMAKRLADDFIIPRSVAAVVAVVVAGNQFGR
jgi:hypothetical protein